MMQSRHDYFLGLDPEIGHGGFFYNSLANCLAFLFSL